MKPIPLPKNTIDETGHTYARLKVQEYAGLDPSSASATWRCLCDCGQTTIVRGARLRSGRIVSCGCWRADPHIRQAARMQTSAKRRREIARMGAAARHEPPQA